ARLAPRLSTLFTNTTVAAVVTSDKITSKTTNSLVRGLKGGSLDEDEDVQCFLWCRSTMQRHETSGALRPHNHIPPRNIGRRLTRGRKYRNPPGWQVKIILWFR